MFFQNVYLRCFDVGEGMFSIEADLLLACLLVSSLISWVEYWRYGVGTVGIRTSVQMI